MSGSKLIELSYYDPSAQVRLSAYADTIVLDHNEKGGVICAIRFGGYPEMVRAMADAIYGGATIEATQNDTVRLLQSSLKGYRRQLTHDGVYAVATLMASDDAQEEGRQQDDGEERTLERSEQPRKCYIFCPEGDRTRLFEELDHKTAAPLIPAFQDYVLASLQSRGDLRQLEVISQKERIDAWVLELAVEDRNVIEVLEEGLKAGLIQIPGAVSGAPDGFTDVNNVTGYLNTFGVTVADRIRNQFMPLFDPASEPLSDEVLSINDFIMQRAGYSLYDAQLAVAEAVKRQLDRRQTVLIIAECGSGKTWTGFMPFMSRATRACTRSFPRNVLGTAICAILPSGGTSAAARFYARTVMRPSKWRSARMGRTTPCRQTNSSFRRSLGKTMSVPDAVPRCGRRSIRTGRPSESRLGNGWVHR